MANPEHIAKLNEGIKVWNKWRKKYPLIKPDLNKAILQKMDLSRGNFQEVNFEEANLTGSIIREANFKKANCKKAKFFEIKCGITYRSIHTILSILIIIDSTLGCYILKDYLIKGLIENCICIGVQVLIFAITYVALSLKTNIRSAFIGLIITTTEILFVFFSIYVMGIWAAPAPIVMVVLLTTLLADNDLNGKDTSIIIQEEAFFIVKMLIVVCLPITIISTLTLGSYSIAEVSIPSYLLSFLVFQSAYVSRQIIRKRTNNVVIELLTTLKGTRFTSANLTGAIFKHADIAFANFLKSAMDRSEWKAVKNTKYADFSDTVLENAIVRDLVISGRVEKDKNYSNLNLQGTNLIGINFSGISLENANLTGANLENAIFFETNLMETKLDRANLNNADFTRAYIDTKSFTRNTILDGVKAEYVYLKLPKEGDRDPNRMPPPQRGKFRENDFYIFITSVLDTLDLYHRQDMNVGVAVTVLKGLAEDYSVQFEIAELGNRGNNQYILKLKVFGEASHFQLKQEYYDRYEQSLLLYDPEKKLMPDIQVAVKEIEKLKRQPNNIYNHDKIILISPGGTNVEGNSYVAKGNDIQVVQGENNYVTQKNYSLTLNEERLTQTQVIELLAELERKIFCSKLPEETKNRTLNRLNIVTEDVKETEPNKQLVAVNFKRVAENLSQATKATKEGKTLWNEIYPMLEKIGTWVGLAGSFFQ